MPAEDVGLNSDWVEDSNGDQMVDASGNWYFIGETPPQLGTPSSSGVGETVANHYHGLVTSRISNGYQITPDHDTYVDNSDPDANFGTDVSLFINTDPPEEMIIFIRHADLTRFNGKILDHAYLYIKHVAAQPAEEISIERVLATWDANSITWNTQPATSPVSAFIMPALTTDTFMVIDITTIAQNWFDGTWDNHGVALVGVSSIATFHQFRSTENAVREDRPFFEFFFWPDD